MGVYSCQEKLQGYDYVGVIDFDEYIVHEKFMNYKDFIKVKKGRYIYIYISKQKYHTVGTVLKSNRKIVETKAKSILLTNIDITIDTPNKYRHYYSLSWLVCYVHFN